jgi:hypothetical protein
MTIDVLDPSPVIRRHAAAQAITRTAKLAQAADRLGHRWAWFVEARGLEAGT